MPELCLVAIDFKVAKISKSQNPDGLTPFGRKPTPAKATHMRIAKPANNSTICVCTRLISAQPAITVTITAIRGNTEDILLSP